MIMPHVSWEMYIIILQEPMKEKDSFRTVRRSKFILFKETVVLIVWTDINNILEA